MQIKLMLNWCVLNQCFVKSLSAQMLVHLFKVYGLDPYEGLCSFFYIYVMTLICTKLCAVFYDYGFDLYEGLCNFYVYGLDAYLVCSNLVPHQISIC